MDDTRETIASEEGPDGVSEKERITRVSEYETIATVRDVEGGGIRLYVGPRGDGFCFGGGSIDLTPSQARHLARLLIAKAC